MGLVIPSTVKLGRLWFKYRGFSPVPLFSLMILLPPEFTPHGIQWVFILTLIFLGEGLRIWGVGYAGSSTRTRRDAIYQLVHAGPFRHLRNPLYLGNILLYVGCSLAFGFFLLSIVTFLYFFTQYSFIVSYEEEMLERHFGERYLKYKSLVPRWLYQSRTDCEKSNHDFRWKVAVASEKSTFIAMIAMATLYFVKLAFLYY